MARYALLRVYFWGNMPPKRNPSELPQTMKVIKDRLGDDVTKDKLGPISTEEKKRAMSALATTLKSCFRPSRRYI